MNIKEQLSNLIEKYNLIDKTFEYFWGCYDNYLTEQPQEAASFGLRDRNSVKPVLYKIDYRLTYGDVVDDDSPCFQQLVVMLDIKDSENFQIGYYECLFSMDGEASDNFFVID